MGELRKTKLRKTNSGKPEVHEEEGCRRERTEEKDGSPVTNTRDLEAAGPRGQASGK